MDIGTRVRVLSVSADDERFDYSRVVGTEGTVIEDPIGWLRQLLGADQELPLTVLLDQPETDPAYEQIMALAPDQVGVIYLAENEVEVIETSNTEDTVNA